MFSGRLGRLGHFGRTLGCLAAIFLIAGVMRGPNMLIVGLVLLALVFIYSLSIGARRLHDMDLSGWLQLFVPLAGFVLPGTLEAVLGLAWTAFLFLGPPSVGEKQIWSRSA